MCRTCSRAAATLGGIGSLATAEGTAGRALSDGIGVGLGAGAAAIDTAAAYAPPKECS